jgi:hypothetical protein
MHVLVSQNGCGDRECRVGHWSVTARLQRVQVVDVEEMAGDRNTRKGSKLMIKRIRSLGHTENASK